MDEHFTPHRPCCEPVITPFLTGTKNRSYAAARNRLGGKPPLAFRYCKAKATVRHSPVL